MPRPAQAYRPFSGTDAAIAAPGEFEIECGTLGLHQRRRLSLVAPALVLNYGVSKNWEAVLEGRQTFQTAASSGRVHANLEDGALLAKSVLRQGSLQHRSGLSVATETGVLLPSSESGMGAQLAAIFSMRWPELTLHVNLTNIFTAPTHYAPRLGVIVEGPAHLRPRPVAEFSFEGASSARTFAWSALVGLIYPLTERLALDFALRGAHVDTHVETSLSLGITWALEASGTH